MNFFEQENNNTRNTAQNLRSISGTNVIKGAISGPAGDFNDFYRFRVLQASKFSAALVPQGQDVNLQLLDSGGSIIDFSNNQGTAIDSVSSENLVPGEYFLQVSGGASIRTDYDLPLTLNPIQRAQIRTTIERVSTRGNFGETPDFVAKSTMDGTLRKTRKIDNNSNPIFNETLTASVDINKRFVPVQISVVDEDFGPDDVADLNRLAGTRDLFLNADVLNSRVSGSGINNQPEGRTLSITGNGDDNKATNIRFKVDYDTFTTSSFSQFTSLSSASTKIGKVGRDRVIGENRTGIIDGRRGNDDLSGMGGNDVILGGLGNDVMRGGTGNDITYGGSGNNLHIGGTGRDTFVLHYGAGVDIIRDFRDRFDRIGLAHGLNFESLDLRQEGRNVGMYAGKDKMVSVRNTRLDQLTAADVVQVDFTTIQGINTPIVL